MAADSRSVQLGTLVSRVTGLGKVAAIAAVLGPTYLGNTYQAINALPNLVFFGLLAGSLFAPLLVPPMVKILDTGDVRAAERLAGGFLSIAMIALGAMTVLAILAGPLVLAALSLGVGQRGVAEAQLQAGWPLLAMLMPQVVLYGVASTAGAAMNARGRFKLAAGAPALENIGIVATLGATLILYGAGNELGEVPASQLLLLGLGTTASVALHAGVQWWGAWRAGIKLIPRAGWRDSEVRNIVRLTRPSLGVAGLGAVGSFGVLIVSNGVPGGVVAFQLALNFYSLAIALGAFPVGLALLPRLGRMFDQGAERLFRDELVRGLSLAFFLTIPAAVVYIALAFPLARAVAFGEMATPWGVQLIAVSLAAVGIGVLGETAFVILTQAGYARREANLALRGMLVRTGVSVVGMLLALSMNGVAALATLGLTISVADLAGGSYLWRRLTKHRPTGSQRLLPSLARAALASVAMAAPAYLLATSVPDLIGGRLGDVLGLLVGAVVGGAIYFALQRAWRGPELDSFLAGLPALNRRSVKQSGSVD